jgi:hypothetical protein
MQAQWLGIACDVGNGSCVRPVIVPYDTGIPYILYIRTSAIHCGQHLLSSLGRSMLAY